MGIDFTAVMDHRIRGLDVDTLPRRLEALWSLPHEMEEWVAEHVRSSPATWRWHLTSGNSSAAEELFNERYVYLDGPDGFSATFHKHGIELTHLARWWSFAYERPLNIGLASAARQVARALGSTKIIYLPDSCFPPSQASDLLFDGKTVADVESFLKAMALPIHSPTELQRPDDSINELGYLVERLTVS